MPSTSKTQKFLGIPIFAIILAVVVVVAGGGSFIIGKYGFSDSYGAKLVVLSDSVVPYTDRDCTIPFDGSVSLNFGEIFGGESSNTVSIFLRNESGGASYIKPSISVDELPVGLTLYEKTYGKIPIQPEWLELFTEEKLDYTPTGLTCKVGYEDISATSTKIFTDICTMENSGYILIGSEVIKYNSITTDASQRWSLNDLQRGQCGTEPVMHEHLATITFINNPSYSPFNVLELGEVQEVSLTVKSNEEVESGEVSFNVLVQATSSH